MDLTKKSALDTESKFKHIFIFFLKEIDGLRYWRKYITTQVFINFNDNYAKKYNMTSCEYWEKKYCIDILGSCNFSSYMGRHYPYMPFSKRDFFEHSYRLFAAFLFIFWKEEYRRYYFSLTDKRVAPIKIDWNSPTWKQNEYLLTYFDSINLKNLIKNWIKLKECCNED